MTSAPCKEAMNDPIPPPPKPQYMEQQSLFYATVKALRVPYDISPALEADLRATDTQCSNNITDSDMESCSSFDVSRLFTKRSGTGSETNVEKMVSFPLPSPKQVASITLRILDLPNTLAAFAIDLFL